MASAKTILDKKIKDTMKALGFKKKKGIYSRIADDVYQGLEIESISSGRCLRVNFDIFPLCYPVFEDICIPLRYEYQPDDKKVGNYLYICEFDPKNEESILKYVDKMYEHIEKNIIPLFNMFDNTEKKH